jgi:hypothetical protein
MIDVAPRLEYDASCEGPDPWRLLPIGPHDHPEPRSMTWTQTELAAIKAYAARCVAADQERWRDAVEALACSWDDPAEAYGMRLALKEAIGPNAAMSGRPGNGAEA